VWALALAIGSALSFLPSLLNSFFAQSERSAHFESYLIMSGIAFASVVPILFVKESSNRSNPRTPSVGTDRNPALLQLLEGRTSSNSRRVAVSSWSRIAQFATVFAFTGFGLGVLVQLLPTWFALRYGASESAVGFWMAVSNFATIVSIPLIPQLVTRRGTVSTAVASAIIGAFVLALMPFSSAFETAAALFAIRSVVVGISWAVVQSYLMGVVNENERATAYAITYTAWGVAVSLGTLIGGELLMVGMLNLPFVAAVISYLASSAALQLFFRKIKPPEEITRFSMPRITE
jgi:hypothetical protein